MAAIRAESRKSVRTRATQLTLGRLHERRSRKSSDRDINGTPINLVMSLGVSRAE